MKYPSIKFILGIALAIPVPSIGWADVVPSPLFTDHMVIQRETQAPVWGTADAGEKVSVTGSWGESAATTADASGKWMVKLKTPEAGVKGSGIEMYHLLLARPRFPLLEPPHATSSQGPV